MLRDTADRVLAAIGLRLTHRRWMPKGTDAHLYRGIGITDPPVIFDVGANVGQTTLEFRKQFPGAVIHAFEPVATSFERLTNNTSHIRNVHRWPVGFSDTAERGVIILAPDSQENRIQTGPAALPSIAPTVTVDMTTLDRFSSEQGVRRIDILKSDTEGHELQVLNGARESLRRGIVRSILVESTLPGLSSVHVSLPAIQELLDPFGFELFGIFDLGYRPSGKLTFFNALFSKEEAPSDAVPTR